MKKIYVSVIILVFVSFSLVGYCINNVTDAFENTYFGFANDQGTRIVATEYGGYHITDPKKLSVAIFSKGKIYKLSFLEYRKESSKSNGRQNSRNFDDCGGYYYQLNGGTVKDGLSCMLVEEGFIKDWKIIDFQFKENLKPAQSTIEKIEQFKKMKVKDIQLLAKFGKTDGLFFVLFTTKTDHLLADLILQKADKFYEDSPGIKVNYVDDYGASFSNLGISNYCDVLDVFSRGDEYVFLLEWYTEEGTHLDLITIQKDILISIKHSARYTYPI